MNGHVRGHYRIDVTGRVEPICDVNASLAKCVYLPPIRRDFAAEQRARITKICLIGVSLFCVGLALMASLPEIQHAIIASESARMASIRRSYLHQHRHMLPSEAEYRWDHRHSDD